MTDTALVIAAFRDIAKSTELDDEELNELVRDAIHAGLARIYGANVETEIDVDTVTGDIEMLVLKRVVDEVEDPSFEVTLQEAQWDDPSYEVGDVMEIPVELSQFGRNAVMAAKQRIVQLVREGERQRIRDTYSDQVGALLSGEVQQIERGTLVLMLNRSRAGESSLSAEAIIPWKEQNPRERFRQGEPMRAVLKKVEETAKGPRLILSRADPLFVAALFKIEVPEIYQGIVEIKELTREVGGRTKIAVHSRDDSIDPVGACVGLKGSRVQAVVAELGGERIDIVPWHPDPEVFARRALAPARVARVVSDPPKQVITAIVDEDQLSLAIGRNGQNVRLASQLIGWQIDLYGSREWLERGSDMSVFVDERHDTYETADFPLSELEIAADTLAALSGEGYESFLDIIDLDRSDLLSVDGLTEEAADHLLGLIEELTVVDRTAEEGQAGGGEEQAAEGEQAAEAGQGDEGDEADEAALKEHPAEEEQAD